MKHYSIPSDTTHIHSIPRYTFTRIVYIMTTCVEKLNHFQDDLSSPVHTEYPPITMDQYAARKRLAIRVRRHYRRSTSTSPDAPISRETPRNCEPRPSRRTQRRTPQRTRLSGKSLALRITTPNRLQNTPETRLPSSTSAGNPAAHGNPLSSSAAGDVSGISSDVINATDAALLSTSQPLTLSHGISHARRVMLSDHLRNIEQEFLYTIGYL